MTFAKLITVLNLLDHDKEIGVFKKSVLNEGDYDRVTSFSKYDEIGNYLEYITDTENDYRFFTLDSEYCLDKEITDEGLEG